MTVAQSEIDRSPADRFDFGPHVATPRSRVEARLVDVLIVGLLALALLGIVGGLRGARADDPSVRAAEPTSSSTEGASGAPAAAAQDGLPVGQAATIGGSTVTVAAAGFEQTLGNQFVGKGYIVASLDAVDSAGKALTYDASHWTLQLPDGQIVQPTEGLLLPVKTNRGREGRVPVQVAFEAGAQRGDFYLLYQPAGTPDRRTWKVAI